MPDLVAYLAGPGRAPWCWGTLDCAQFGCGWVVAATGRDPGAAFRGRYATRTGAHRFILAAGGVAALLREPMAACGFGRTQEPETGDIGVVDVPVDARGRRSAVVAIRLGGYWVVRGETKLVMQDFPMRAAWSIA